MLTIAVAVLAIHIIRRISLLGAIIMEAYSMRPNAVATVLPENLLTPLHIHVFVTTSLIVFRKIQTLFSTPQLVLVFVIRPKRPSAQIPKEHGIILRAPAVDVQLRKHCREMYVHAHSRLSDLEQRLTPILVSSDV